MMLPKRTGHLAIEQELNLRCAKFFEVARYVALEKTRVTGNPAGAHEYALSDRIQQVLKSVIAVGSTTGWGQPLAPYAQLADAFLIQILSGNTDGDVKSGPL